MVGSLSPGFSGERDALLRRRGGEGLPWRWDMQPLLKVIGVDLAKVSDCHRILQAAITAMFKISFAEEIVEQI